MASASHHSLVMSEHSSVHTDLSGAVARASKRSVGLSMDDPTGSEDELSSNDYYTSDDDSESLESDSDDYDDDDGPEIVYEIPTEKCAQGREGNCSGGIILDGAELSNLLNKMRLGQPFSIDASSSNQSVPARRSSTVPGVFYFGEPNPDAQLTNTFSHKGRLSTFPSLRSASMPSISEMRLRLMRAEHAKSEQALDENDEMAAGRPDIDCPNELVKYILEENGFKSDLLPSDSVPRGFFQEITEERVRSYQMDVITAVQSQDIETLRNFRDQKRNLLCCNKFGESILHMACRRGSTDVAKFLVTEALVSVRQRDDYGKTPMHDACWTVNPCYQLVELLIRCCPDLLLICDKRNHTPMQYVSKDNHTAFCKLLWQKRDIVKPRYLVPRIKK